MRANTSNTPRGSLTHGQKAPFIRRNVPTLLLLLLLGITGAGVAFSSMEQIAAAGLSYSNTFHANLFGGEASHEGETPSNGGNTDSGEAIADTVRRVFLAPSLEGLSKDLAQQKFLFIASRDDGFSNQRITVAQGLHCAKMQGRVAVLPPVFADVRYGVTPKGPYLFRNYFDLDDLAAAGNFSFATPGALAKAGVKCDILSCAHDPKRVLGVYESDFGWTRKTVDQCRLPNDATCVTQSSCKYDWMTARGPFGKYSNFSSFGQGYNLLASENFRRVRAALRPSRAVQDIAQVVQESIGPAAFNAVHLRRSDFRAKCNTMPGECEHFGKESFVPSGDTVVERVMALPSPLLPLFVATEDPKWVRATLAPELRAKGVVAHLAQDVSLPPKLSEYKDRVDMLSYATQIVASRAESFVGNRFSSFSSEIFNERLLRNSSEEKLFF